MSLSTINYEKERPLTHAPLLLYTFAGFPDGSVLRLSSEPLDAAHGGNQYNGNDYFPRIRQQDISVIQALAQSGIAEPETIKLTLEDSDQWLWTNWEQADGKGFFGATVTATLVLWDAGTGNFSTDSFTRFVGTCGIPARDAKSITIQAGSKLNLLKVYLPDVRIGKLCPWAHPDTAAQKADATNPFSIFYQCGDVDPSHTSCSRTKAACVANGRWNPSTNTYRFGGIQWDPPQSWSGNSFISGKNEQGDNNPNLTKYKDYFPILLGTCWAQPPIMNVDGDPNSTRMEVALCARKIKGIRRVVVNDHEVTNQDNLYRFNQFTDGSPDGRPNTDAIFDGKGDCYGGIAAAEIVVLKSLASSNSIPNVSVLGDWLEIPQYIKIDHITNGVVTFANNVPNVNVVGNSPFTVTIGGNSGVNGTFGLTSWSYGPPGTVTLSGTTGSGTGGYLCYVSHTSNPAWHLLYCLVRAGWDLSIVGADAWSSAAAICDVPISYTDLTGTANTHPRFSSSLPLRQRRSVSEIVRGLLAGVRGCIRLNPKTGLYDLLIWQTLADQQPAAIDGSNYTTPIASKKADGTTANGYVAYSFDDSSVLKSSDGKPDVNQAGRQITDSPNVITVQFQDEGNQWVQDSLSIADTDALFRVGQETPDTREILGINNYDQARRVLNTALAELTKGNEAGDSRGTRIYDFPTSVKAAHLQVADLIRFGSQKLNIPTDLYRIVKIQPAANFETARLTIQGHKDEWYVDGFMQAADPQYSAQRRRLPARAPFGWQANDTFPSSGDPLQPTTAGTFGISQQYTTLADGTAAAQAVLTGNLPVNSFSPLTPPMLPQQGTTANTGGTVPGGLRYYMVICGEDADGLLTPVSDFCYVDVPAGATNTIGISGIYWPSTPTKWHVFAGSDPYSLTHQQSGTGAPASVTIAAILASAWGVPDVKFDHLRVRVKEVYHAGVAGFAINTVTAGNIKIGGAGWTAGQWTGRVVSCFRVGTTPIPIANFTVTGNTSDTLALSPDPVTVGIAPGDALVIRAQANISSANTIGDSGFQNPTAPAGLAVNAEKGRLALIAWGKGAGQYATVASNTGTTCTIEGEWDVIPDATSGFLLVDQNWITTVDGAAYANTDPGAGASLNVAVDNFLGEVVLVRVYTVDANGAECPEQVAPWREIYIAGQSLVSTETTIQVSYA